MSRDRFNVVLVVQRQDGTISKYYHEGVGRMTVDPFSARNLSKLEADDITYQWLSKFTPNEGWRIEVVNAG